MDPPPWAPPPRAGVELRVRAVGGLHPASRAAVAVTVASPAGDKYSTSDSPVIDGRARLEAWARLALPREAGAQRALTFEVRSFARGSLGPGTRLGQATDATGRQASV